MSQTTELGPVYGSPERAVFVVIGAAAAAVAAVTKSCGFAWDLGTGSQLV